MPIYAAGEKEDYGLSLEELARDMYTTGEAKILTTVDELVDLVKSEERTYIFMGAGTISQMAYEVVEKMEE